MGVFSHSARPSRARSNTTELATSTSSGPLDSSPPGNGRHATSWWASSGPMASVATVCHPGSPCPIAGGPSSPPARCRCGDASKSQRPLYLHDLNFVKFLGWGGQGIVALLDCRDNNGNSTQMVAKCDMPGIKARVSEEKKHQEVFRRAAHIVQTIIPSTRTRPEAFGTTVAPPRSIHSIRDVLVMEYLEGGNMRRWMASHFINQVEIPEGCLWHIMECLVRGCIAMQFPPKGQRGQCKQDYRNTGGERGPPIDETIPPVAEQNPYYGVHFDLDPSNGN